jgi:hypothetical protein
VEERSETTAAKPSSSDHNSCFRLLQPVELLIIFIAHYAQLLLMLLADDRIFISAGTDWSAFHSRTGFTLNLSNSAASVVIFQSNALSPFLIVSLSSAPAVDSRLSFVIVHAGVDIP